MSTNEAEQNVLDYLMRTRALDREAASNFLHQNLHHNWFSSKEEPEIAGLVTTPHDTIGWNGRSR
jgi:hypothetical protein